VVKRGEIWWVDFGEPQGSEPGYRRPAVIVSSDRFNRSRIRTVLVAAVTSNVSLAAAPGNITLAPDETGLDRPSVVNVSQLACIDRSMLVRQAGTLPAPLRQALDTGLRLALAL
jgi:mRNA interferase MazF